MKISNIIILFFLITGCHLSNDCSDLDINEKILKHLTIKAELSYSDGAFVIPYGGYLYNPNTVNTIGNFSIYLIPKEYKLNLDIEQYENYINNINKLSTIIKNFEIYIFLIPKKYLVLTPEGYYPNEKHIECFYKYDENQKKIKWVKSKKLNLSNKNYQYDIFWSERIVKKRVKAYRLSSINKIKNLAINSNWHGHYRYLTDEGHTAGGSWTGVYHDFHISKDSVICRQEGYMAYNKIWYLAQENKDTLELYRYKELNSGTFYKNVKKSLLYWNKSSLYLKEGEEHIKLEKMDKN
ncbi:MAG: DUF5991 domain-containing protein [Flavobacteriaceae bacterium]|nr:DUF5991 domain-containing protein [Flavobacteriaceae bacterium]